MKEIPILEVKNLSKKYYKGKKIDQHSLSKSIIKDIKHPFQWLNNQLHFGEPFQALDNVSFNVEPGEVIGIIGRNGAGKSTLLKIISNITYPSQGKVILRGRVGSLLEVGTGFHPAMTGRENIYLNGQILGMKKKEIDEKFDEIVSFSGIEDYLDTPVKRYSSGMAVRLGFAVAAHLEPEILVVDEVLAVGDSQFQKKCKGKMQEISEHGRTILFVSHNMAMINRLCQRGILLEKGVKTIEGPIDDVVSHYLQSETGNIAEHYFSDIDNRPGNNKVQLIQVRIIDQYNNTSSIVDINKKVGVYIQYEVLRNSIELVPNFHIFADDGVYTFVSIDVTSCDQLKNKGIYESVMWIPENLLNETNYYVGIAITSLHPWEVHFFERDVVSFRVRDFDENPLTRGSYGSTLQGVVRPVCQWETNEI